MGFLQEFAHALWSIGLFIPLFCSIFLISLIKAVLTGSFALAMVFVGNVAVVIGLWLAFVFWTYRSVIKTKKFGLSLKFLSLICLPVPLVIWPVIIMLGSFLVGLGYGFFAPMIATFEAVGVERENKLFHCITDGVWGTLKGSCTIVRDFFDWCYHSYPAYMDDFRQGNPKNGKPYTIKFLEVPQCAVVGALGVLVDVPIISIIAVLKSPIMLLKGWKKLFNDFIARDGACTKAVCVPFTGISIVLWPLVVVSGLVTIILGSFFLGLFGGVVVYQESSFLYGLAYIVAVIAEFDEYSNDALYLREGSYLPRPRYRKHVVKPERPLTASIEQQSLRQTSSLSKPSAIDQQLGSGSRSSRSTSHSGGKLKQLTTSKSVRQTIQEVQMMQIWDHFFKTIQLHGKVLFEVGVIKTSDLEDYVRSTKREKSTMVELGLPAYTLLKNLMIAAKSDSPGLVLYDGQEVTSSNRPHDRLMDWFFDPLVVLKEQIKAACLQPTDEHYLEKLVLSSGHPEQLDFWQNGSIEPESNVKKGELQAIARRIQGITTSASRFPTFPRRFQQFVKTLLVSGQTQSIAQANEGTLKAESKAGEMSEISIGVRSGDDAV